jgi:hypothetical protein
MRTRLTLLLLLTTPAWSGPAHATQGDKDPDAAVVRADAALPPGASRPLDAARAARGGDTSILEVVSSYGRALETQDVGLFRSVMPDMGIDAETRLRKAFRSIGSQQVHMTVEAVDVDGPTAVVRVLREDTVDGYRMKRMEQSFRLVRRDGGWRIDSMAFRR